MEFGKGHNLNSWGSAKRHVHRHKLIHSVPTITSQRKGREVRLCGFARLDGPATLPIAQGLT